MYTRKVWQEIAKIVAIITHYKSKYRQIYYNKPYPTKPMYVQQIIEIYPFTYFTQNDKNVIYFNKQYFTNTYVESTSREPMKLNEIAHHYEFGFFLYANGYAWISFIYTRTINH